ncbi:MAG: hypothetical protein HYT83_01735 [Candidatus Levybacteria bacterium]|nr:hypothetical protein [Candidatus Levybacteria bacterium]
MKGQTLIEVLVALGVAIVLIFAITIIVINTLNNLATQIAQEGMELVRKQKQSNQATFNSLSGDYCLGKEQTILSPKVIDCSQNVDIFKREIKINRSDLGSCDTPSANDAKVIVTVLWFDNKCTSTANLFCHNVKLISCFSDVANIPTP